MMEESIPNTILKPEKDFAMIVDRSLVCIFHQIYNISNLNHKSSSYYIIIMIRRVCSLGSFCHTASHLERYHMRNCAYPFDWTLSSPQMIIDCLRDDFRTFLDPTHHVTVEPGISSNHLIYGSMVWGKNFDGIFNQHLTFAHKDVTIADHYAYYQRCVQRFRDLLATPEPKLFILIAQDMEYNSKEIHELRDMLRQRTRNSHLLCISLFNENESRYTFDQEDGIKYLKIYTYSRSDGRGFAKAHDNEYLHYLINCLYTFT
jgi:hypothetical protein